MHDSNAFAPILLRVSRRLLPAPLLLLLALPALAGPALPEVRTVASDHARFSAYEIVPDGDGLRIRGHLLKSPAYPASLLGRIRVELLDADGRLINDFITDHRHFPSRQQRLRFQVRIPQLPPELHHIRLQHLS